MRNLKQWNFIETFTGIEAAALILGLDPIQDDCSITEPVLRRMKLDYERALLAHQTEVWWEAAYAKGIGFFREIENNEDDPYVVTNLHCWQMSAFILDAVNFDSGRGYGRIRNGLYELAHDKFKRWLFDDLLNGFDHQLFERFELGRWLSESGLESDYQFSTHDAIGQKSGTSAKGLIYGPSVRRDLISPAIEHAQSLCGNSWSAQEVWARLRQLAQDKYQPLIGIDETGIQYMGAKEELKTLSFGALSMRFARARKLTRPNDSSR